MLVPIDTKWETLPQFADIFIVLAVSVGTGVGIRGGVERLYTGVGAIGSGWSSAWEAEDTAHSEALSTGAGASSSQTGALGEGVAGSVEIFAAGTLDIGELDYVENWKLLLISLFTSSSADQIEH